MRNDNMDLTTGGVKFDAGKIRMDLLPPDAAMAVSAIFTYGAHKYDDWNWAKGMRAGRIMAAMQRHQAAYMLGEELDEESGLPHLWHMGCCAMMMISADLRGVLEDDRPCSPAADVWFPEAGSAEECALDIVRDSMNHMNDPAGTPLNAGGTIAEDDNDNDGDRRWTEHDWDWTEEEMDADPSAFRDTELEQVMREYQDELLIKAWRSKIDRFLSDIDFASMVQAGVETKLVLPQPPEGLVTEEEGTRIIQEVITAYIARAE